MTERDRYPDDVKRVKDEMDYHAVMGHSGWIVLALADGTPLDHVPYETWSDACKAAGWDRDRYIFCEIQPDGCGYREAQAILKYARTLYDRGFRIPSPDWDAGPLASSMPRTQYDRNRMGRQLISGRALYPEGSSNLPSLRKKGK